MKQPSHYAAGAEIRQEISRAFTANQNECFQLNHADCGDFTVHIEQYAGFSVMNNIYRQKQQTLHIPIRPEVPSLLMSFCMKGNPGLAGQGWEVKAEPNRYLFNLFPARDSTYILPPHSQVEDMVIELEMHSPFLQELISDSDDALTHRLHRSITRQESLHQLQGSFQIDPATAEILSSIQTCPYTGKMREVYLESQVKLMLIHQLSVVHQLEQSLTAGVSNKLSKADREKLQELKLYLETHFLEEHSLQALSKRFALNLFKLKYGFKTLFNTSVMKFIDDKKLNYAHLLLQQENTTIFEVADALHYGHYNNFSAAYKRKFGYSPQALRKG